MVLNYKFSQIGPRTVTAILRYVINQIMNPIQVYENLDNLEPNRQNQSLQKSLIVGYFNRLVGYLNNLHSIV